MIYPYLLLILQAPVHESSLSSSYAPVQARCSIGHPGCSAGGLLSTLFHTIEWNLQNRTSSQLLLVRCIENPRADTISDEEATCRNQTIPDGIDPATVPQTSEPRIGFLVPVEDSTGKVIGSTPYYRAPTLRLRAGFSIVLTNKYTEWSLYTADNKLIYQVPLYGKQSIWRRGMARRTVLTANCTIGGPNVVNFTISSWFPAGSQYVLGWIDATYPNTVNTSVFSIVEA